MRDECMRVILITLLVAACSEDPPGSGGPNVNSHVDSYDYPGSRVGNLDLLFVIDNTTAMAPYQSQLSDLATAVDAMLPNDFDVRIAVTTTDASAGGALRPPATTSDPFVASTIDAHFNPAQNFTGTLADALAPALAVGATSSAAVRPLESMKLALDANPSFAREASMLVVMTIAASDDASADATSTYANALKARKTDPSQVAVYGVYPMPAARLDAFHAVFPNRSGTFDLTTTTLAAAVPALDAYHRTVLGYACPRLPLDVDPTTPGPQYDCDFAAYYEDGTSETLRMCTPGGAVRCVEFVADTQACMDPKTGRFYVRGYVGGLPHVRGQCVVEGL